jgi:hypothetical protein
VTAWSGYDDRPEPRTAERHRRPNRLLDEVLPTDESVSDEQGTRRPSALVEMVGDRERRT